MEIKKKTLINLFRSVATIVLSEEKIIKHYQEDNMKSPMHMSMGDENCVSGVVESFKGESFFFGYYRTHSLYLSVTNNMYKFFAELHGRVTGSNAGVAGSMHMTSIDDNLLSNSAIVASTIPLSLGAALSCLKLKNNKYSVVFFGDGAIEEGVFHEAMNMSSLMKLPVVFVCLDNGLAVDIESNDRQGFKSIKRIVESYDCKYFHSANAAATDIYKISEKAKAFITEDQKPVFIHLECYRYLQHIGTNNDFEDSEHVRLLSKYKESGVGFEKKNYRSKDEYKKYLNNKPLDLIRRSARELGLLEDEMEQEIINIKLQIDIDFSRALKDKPPEKKDLFKGIF
jgi:TPP-dependent pyruvate/acetoin dehydrogenase alpha subunit